MLGRFGCSCIECYYKLRNYTQTEVANVLLSGGLHLDYFVDRYITVSYYENPRMFGEDKEIILGLLLDFKDFLADQDDDSKFAQIAQKYASEEFGGGWAFLVYLDNILAEFHGENSKFYANLLRAYVLFMRVSCANYNEGRIIISQLLKELLQDWEHMYEKENKRAQAAILVGLLSHYINLDQAYIDTTGESILYLLSDEQYTKLIQGE